jgi:hypothetical protein
VEAFDTNVVAAALRRLLSVEGVTVEYEPATVRGLDVFEAGPADCIRKRGIPVNDIPPP